MIVRSVLCSCFLVILCDSAELQVTIEGTDRSESCLGENITYTCTVSSLSHLWTAPGLGLPDSAFITTVAGNTQMKRYYLRLVSSNTTMITSALSVISDSDFNNTNVMCSDGLGITSEPQQTVAVVLAPPSAPSLDAVAGNNFMTVDFTITPPMISAVCVLTYIITPTRINNGVRLDNISVDANERNIPIQLQGEGDFDLCRESYNFTVTQTTMNGTEEMSNLVTITSPGPITGIRTTSDSLVWLLPSDVPAGCFDTYIIDNGTISYISSTNMVSSSFLRDAGFSYCVHHTITITPRDVMNRSVNTSQLSVENVVINDPNLVDPVLSLSSRLDPNDNTIYNVTVSWIPPSTEMLAVSVMHSMLNMECSENLDTSGTTSAMIKVPCNDGGGTVRFCAQYTLNDCRTNITTEMISIPSCAPPSSAILPIVVGVVVPLIFIIVLVIIIVLIIFCCCKIKGDNYFLGTADDDEHELRGTPSYAASPAVYTDNDGTGGLYDEVTTQSASRPEDHLPTYQAPDTIRREAAGAGAGGDMYTVPDKKPKKKNVGGVSPSDVADMYSVPDKTKKKQNEGMMYADIDMSRPSKKRAPPPPNQGFVVQEDLGSVTYSTVNH